MNTDATILAIASPPGRSLRGIIRTSGPDAFALMEAASDERAATQLLHASAQSSEEDGGYTRHPSPSRAATPIAIALRDDIHLGALQFAFAAPRSYTGEDSIELQLPGNPALLERIINRLLEIGAARDLDIRRAQPGEFTARAFLNGRLDLTQAEGVAATIAAQSDAELAAARLLTSGRLGGFAHDLADELAAALALVEAGIDFTDQDDVIAIAPSDLHARLIDLRRRLNDQLNRATGMEQLRAIPWVTLVGEPNAGKSALFNALLGRERAVVSSIAGTTRDVLAEPLRVETEHGTAEVMLVDLAGLDQVDSSSTNALMQAAAQAAIERAELKLRCVPIDKSTGPQVHKSTNDFAPDEIIVYTKSDLRRPEAACGVAHSRLSASAITGEGLPALRSAIAKRLAHRAVSLAADALALQPRHESAMRSALSNLDEAIALTAPNRAAHALPNSELIASTMRAALDDLASLAGDITPEDILGRIFSSFCIGK